MGKLLRFKSIKTKILFGFGIALGLVIFLGIFNFYSITIMNNNTRQIVEEDSPILAVADDLAISVSEMIGAVRGYVLTENESYNDLFFKYVEEREANQDRMLSLTDSEEINQLIDRQNEWEVYMIDNVFNQYQSGNKDLAINNLIDSLSTTQEVIDGFKSFSQSKEADLVEQANQTAKIGETSLILSVTVSLLVVIIGTTSAIVTANSISNPIKIVMKRMRAIANGDLTNDTLETNLIDETGQLIGTTNELNQTMKDLLSEISNVSEMVSTQSEELTQSVNEVTTGSQQIVATMQELASGSETEANHASELSTLTSSFAKKVVQMNENGANVHQSSLEVLKMTNSGYELMETSTKQMNLVDQIVHEAVEKVEQLNIRSQKISELILVVQDIAEQTNLLALNAAIEAARAGEHGKGFAVVADEVRKLAEGTSASVADITEIVNGIQTDNGNVTDSLQTGYQEVEKGTSQIRSTGETFSEISKAVEAMVNDIKTVTDNLVEMTDDSQRMNGSIQEIASISEESAAGVEQTSASAQQTNSAMEEVAASSNDLAKIAEKMNDLIKQFKL